jgi:preprotein translocase subunit SecA
LPDDLDLKLREFSDPRQITAYLFDLIDEVYRKKEEEQGEMVRLLEKMVYLRVIDSLWIRHLTEMDYLRQGIGLRGYGQRDPLVEYKFESHRLFNQLLENIDIEVVNTIFKVSIVPDGTARRQQQAQEIKQETSAFGSGQRSAADNQQSRIANRQSPAVSRKKVGRNDPCPCGARYPDGRPIKYKHCHGK